MSISVQIRRALFITALLPASQLAQAGYTGPSAPIQTSIAAVLDNPEDNQGVQLQGYLIKKLSHEKYWFSDGAQQIRVEIEQEDFPAEPFDEHDLIEIFGEVEQDFLESPEIDVEKVVLKKSS